MPRDEIELIDVMDIFEEAGRELDDGSLVASDQFTLNDAMSAIEIGDPRMDSGAPRPETAQQPAFNPFTPLLPEEVCWILDRTFACEMQWHSGYALSQTVHTCVYMHHLQTLGHNALSRDPLVISSDTDASTGHSKLLTLILWAGVLGMVKCCDLAYRELVKGNVHDCEDCQLEKMDTSLYESLSANKVISHLEDAIKWLKSDEATSIPHRKALRKRLSLRKNILQLFSAYCFSTHQGIPAIIAEARRRLEHIKAQPRFIPLPGSVAYLSFDPYITRTLPSLMAMKVLTPLPQDKTWLAVSGLLDGWEELSRLAVCENFLTWNTASNVRACLPTWRRRRIPYLRSLAQSTFSNGTTILDSFSSFWVVDRFFTETINVQITRLNSVFGLKDSSFKYDPFVEFLENLAKLLIQSIWACYHNRPRHRRHLMKTASDWHALYDFILSKASQLTPKDASDTYVIRCAPLALLHWRMCTIRDIVLSGFELELYSPDERSFAYWYLSKLLAHQESVLSRLQALVPSATPASHYLHSQFEYTVALRLMSSGSFLLCSTKSSNSPARRYLNFVGRYKWATLPDTSRLQTEDMLGPQFELYFTREKEVLNGERIEDGLRIHEFFAQALHHLLSLGELIEKDESFQLCKAEFTQHLLSGLTVTCESLEEISSKEQDKTIHVSRLKWVSDICQWFPQISAEHQIPATTGGAMKR